MRLRPVAFALVGVALVWAWLWFGVPLLGAIGEGLGNVAAEALFTLAVYAPILLAALLLGRLAEVPIGRPDRAATRRFGGGAVIGSAALALAIGYCGVAGTLFRGTSAFAASAFAVGLATITLQVLAEEAMFRGTIQPLLVNGLGRLAGVAATAFAFALLHGGAPGIDGVTIVNMLLGGVVFGALALRGGGIAAAFGAHLAWNAIEQIGVGLDPNPGTGAFGALLDLDLAGSVRWGGSDAGLNASLAMTFALAAAVALILRWGNPRIAPSMPAPPARAGG
ncbi:type II CAAX prenyl endopeptidase Rce1 family protein [Sphingomonas sp. NBWT7]|uniref:CPBP family glutamic-type intramembrane protease n=1 Tax=Sphingomonas sp. NBWT7 TaxID=2596913 RepID=UPI0016238220|nr:CPBP family glutamic-type intramembrane protease [Sphingomonas sp. NBWT7]